MRRMIRRIRLGSVSIQFSLIQVMQMIAIGILVRHEHISFAENMLSLKNVSVEPVLEINLWVTLIPEPKVHYGTSFYSFTTSCHLPQLTFLFTWHKPTARHSLELSFFVRRRNCSVCLSLSFCPSVRFEAVCRDKNFGLQCIVFSCHTLDVRDGTSRPAAAWLAVFHCTATAEDQDLFAELHCERTCFCKWSFLFSIPFWNFGYVGLLRGIYLQYLLFSYYFAHLKAFFEVFNDARSYQKCSAKGLQRKVMVEISSRLRSLRNYSNQSNCLVKSSTAKRWPN